MLLSPRLLSQRSGHERVVVEQWIVHDDCVEFADLCLGHGLHQHLFAHDAHYMDRSWRYTIHWYMAMMNLSAIIGYQLTAPLAARFVTHPVYIAALLETVVILGAMFIDPEETRREMAKHVPESFNRMQIDSLWFTGRIKNTRL